MALGVICENGHGYIQSDIYLGPNCGPHCPECFNVWIKDPENQKLYDKEYEEWKRKNPNFFRERGTLPGICVIYKNAGETE